VSESPPTRRRGLKQQLRQPEPVGDGVASHAEARIETSFDGPAAASARSPPTRRRGLKQAVMGDRVRGAGRVASHAEARIETHLLRPKVSDQLSRLPRGGAD